MKECEELLETMKRDFIEKSAALIMESQTEEELEHAWKAIHRHLDECMKRRVEFIGY